METNELRDYAADNLRISRNYVTQSLEPTVPETRHNAAKTYALQSIAYSLIRIGDYLENMSERNT